MSDNLFKEISRHVVNGADGQRSLPPVHLWDPPFCGDIDMRITRDGRWWYMGTPIGREVMVRLFASVLKLEDEQYFLVTPVEKVGIVVEDAPFVAVLMQVTQTETGEPCIALSTNVGDQVIVDAEHPLWVEVNEEGEPAPYVHVRSGLNALIHRNVFYQLVDMAEEVSDDSEANTTQLVVSSSGVRFSLGDLPA